MSEQVPQKPEGRAPENWLARVLARARGARRGDVIAANVGAGAQNVAVGKFILQTNVRIGTLVIPAKFILALVGVALVVVLAVWFLRVPAQMPADTFNVAVAEFGQVGADGRVSASDDGSRLSAWMFGKLSDEARNLKLDQTVTVWHRGSFPLQTRSLIGPVENEAQAAALAQQLNARMVIYGNLALNQDPATFTPRFYVAAAKGEADELVGGQQLGAPIPIQPPIDFNQPRTDPYLNRFLAPRATVLIYITRGLTYDLTGDYAAAYEIFKQAQSVFNSSDSAQGQDVVDYFLGREALFLAQDDNMVHREFNSADDALAAAETALKAALALSPNYARAEFLLGNVYGETAQRLILKPNAAPEDLARARTLLDQEVAQHLQALRDAPQAPGSGVEYKAQISLGTAYLLQGTSFLVGSDYASAIPLFETAAATMEKALPTVPSDDHRNRAQTYEALGAAYYEQAIAEQRLGNPAQSKQHYLRAQQYDNDCIQEANAQIEDTFLQEVMSQHCKPDLENVNKALAALGG